MSRLSEIFAFWNKKETDDTSGTLIADFGQLTRMRKYVPYLRGAHGKLSSDQTGNLKSSFKGRGMEFEEIRAYNYGDDVRDIDWRVTARKNQPYTKLYAEEKDREVWAWIDMSAQMRFGTRQELKSVTAAKTAALIGWLALARKDRFGVAVFDGHKTHLFFPNRTEENLLSIFKQLEHIAQNTLYDQNDSENILKSWTFLQQHLHHRSIIFIIGTFDEMNEAHKKIFLQLGKGRELYLINIYDALEAVAPPRGEYLAEFQHKRRILKSNGARFSSAYEAYFAKKRNLLQAFCFKFNITYFEIRTDFPIYMQISLI